jgi:adenine-specific DNA-methyltransferase
LPELLAKATKQKLTEAEAWALAEALRVQGPWLEWAGKREAKTFLVDPVALHIHERVSTQAILRVAAREDVNRSLFADPEQEYNEAVQFYKHDVDWSNRLILGDSLQVMSSLARREDLAGKVQMIYMDPPYGIKFASNFQPEIGKREVKDKEADLTREPEMVKAYRDTWTLGVHSYLAYLRDRLTVARDLLADSGSVFVQISDENVHRVRCLLDEVFGADNFAALITFRTTSSLGGQHLGPSANYLLWYARDKSNLKFRNLFRSRGFEDDIGGRFTRALLPGGAKHVLTTEERDDPGKLPKGTRIYRHDNLTSQSGGTNSDYPVEFQENTYRPGRGFWKTNPEGMARLVSAERIAAPTPNSLTYVRFLDDFPLTPLTEVWGDTQTGAFTDPKVYVVQTNAKVIERCILMTTDPGDLVLDPTCGSGTTASIAEDWGRRWITVDTSRVAVALARQRILTAKYEYFKLRDESAGVAQGLRNRTVPHVMLRTVAQNSNLDPIFAKHGPILDERLGVSDRALNAVPDQLRSALRTKLALKQKHEGKKAITESDRRRWELPAKGRGWRQWEVPFDTDQDYPADLKKAVEEYRAAWRAKMDEVNACIARPIKKSWWTNQRLTARSRASAVPSLWKQSSHRRCRWAMPPWSKPASLASPTNSRTRSPSAKCRWASRPKTSKHT